MKLTLLFTIILACSGVLPAFSQTINYVGTNVRLENVLKAVEEQTNVSFFYDGIMLRNSKPVTVAASGMQLKLFLDEILKNQPYRYRIENKLIIISAKSVDYQKKNVIADILNKKSVSEIHGVVENESGQPLEGASVRLKNSTIGSTTDSLGGFTLKVDNKDTNTEIIVSFVGYEDVAIRFTEIENIHVQMKLAENTMQDMIMTGYGSIRKKSLTGAVGIIKSNEIDGQINGNLGAALQGKIAGLNIITNTGQPGEGLVFQIRGAGSLNNTNPLILVDDIPVTGINNLNPSDIASIQVMKDASAAAIYGARAANGVILINTKSGKPGPIKIDAVVDYGVQVPKKLELLGADEWIKVIKEMYRADSLTLPSIATNPQQTGKGVDWQDLIYRNAPVQNYSIGASGGSKHLVYKIFLAYLAQDGIVKTTSYDRFSMNIKTEFTKGRFRVGETLLLAKERQQPVADGKYGLLSNPVGSAVAMIPAFNVYDENAIGGFAGAYGEVAHIGNPLATLNVNKQDNGYLSAQLNLYGEVTLIDGLKFRTSLSVKDLRNNRVSRYQRYQVGAFFQDLYNNATYATDVNQFWQLENTLSYEKTFGDKHSINVLAGQLAFRNSSRNYSAYREGMPDGIWELSAGSGASTVSGLSFENTLASYLSRIIYTYDNRFAFTGIIRRDGSSRFGKENPWANFPSLALAWNVSNEAFFRRVTNLISELRIRASWGKLGNQEIGDYAYISTVTQGRSYNINGVLWPGTIVTNMVSKDLKWEETSTSNLGIDLGLFKGKVNLTVDVFDKTTTNILMATPIPNSAGYDNSPLGNAGKVKNKGVELTLNYSNRKKYFSYSATAVVSHVKNKIVELVEGAESWTGGLGEGGLAVLYPRIGYPLYSFFLIKSDGLFRSQADIDSHSKNGNPIQPKAQLGDVKFVDANGDGIISDDIRNGDRVYAGSPFPNYEFGFRLDGSWKCIDVSVYLQGVQGNKIFNSSALFLENGRYVQNFSKNLLNSYTFNADSDVPRLTSLDPNHNGYANNDRFLEDGSYIVNPTQIDPRILIQIDPLDNDCKN